MLKNKLYSMLKKYRYQTDQVFCTIHFIGALEKNIHHLLIMPI